MEYGNAQFFGVISEEGTISLLNRGRALIIYHHSFPPDLFRNTLI